MTLATGGSAFGDISTKSTSASSAINSASLRVRIPSWSPFTPMTLNFSARIASLMRIDVPIFVSLFDSALSVYSYAILSDKPIYFNTT